MLGTTDWLLKRFLKFVLKRNVGKYLTSEIDLEQLDIKLDTGKLELKNLLLDCDAVNKDLGLDGWHVKAGYVGSVNAKLPSLFSSSSQCSVVVNEVMLTVAPALADMGVGTCAPDGSQPSGSGTRLPAPAFPQAIPTPSPAVPNPAPHTSTGGAMGFLLADDFGWTGHGVVMDGIKRIAASLQSLLQHMRVEASNVLIRVELPHPTEKGSVVTAALKLDLVEFSDLSSMPASAGSTTAPKHHRHQNEPLHPSQTYRAQQPRSPIMAPTGACDSGGAAAAAAGANPNVTDRWEVAKHIQVRGLSLDLFEATPLLIGAIGVTKSATGKASSPPASPLPPSWSGGSAAAATATTAAGVTLVSGPGKQGLQLSVELRMRLPEEPSQPTQVAADLHLGAVRLQFLPRHAVCLAALKAAFDRQGTAAAAPDSVTNTTADGGGTELWASSYASASASMHSTAAGGCGGHWGKRSLIESIMMPNCEDVVTHSLEPYMMGVSLSYGDASEFHDTCSRFGSLASSLVSSVTRTGNNLPGYVAASGNAAVDWMGAVIGTTSQVQPCAPLPPSARAGDLQPPAAPAGSVVPRPAPAATVAAEAAPQAPQPVICVRAHVAHAAFVLCYGSPSSLESMARTTAAVAMQFRNGGSSGAHACGGSGMGSFRIGPTNGPMALTHGSPQQQLSSGAANPGAAGGSLVAELQDLGCDVLLDAARGNVVSLQAGQLQVYEQLPTAVGAQYGMTPAEWGKVPEALPQAPYRFRPTQPAPARTSVCSGAVGGCGLRLGTRPSGRNAQAAAAAAAGSCANGGAGPGLQTWPILMCASTHCPSSGAAGPYSHAQPHTPGHSCTAVKAVGNRPAAQSDAQHLHGGAGAGHACSVGGAAAAGHGSSSLRLRAAWGGSSSAPEGTAAAVGDGDAGYDRYGSGALSVVPSYDLSIEVLPVTVWLSLPLVQRLTDFAAPLASTERPPQPSRTASGDRTIRYHPPPQPQRGPKPHTGGTLPRLSLTVVAPHVCVLLALVPSSPSSSAAAAVQLPLPPRPPGTPVFIALDVVSPPHPSVETMTHESATHRFQGLPHYSSPHLSHNHPQQPPQHTHTHQQQHHHHHHHHSPYHQPPYATHNDALYGTYGAPTSYGNVWPGAGSHHHNHPYGTTHGNAAGSQTGRLAAGTVPYLAPPSAWAAPELPPLLTVYQAPVTDRLIPSQVTTVDLAVATVELLLLRTAPATTVNSTTAAAEGFDRDQGAGGDAVHHRPGGGGPAAASSESSQGRTAATSTSAISTASSIPAPWICKPLFSLSPTPPQPPATTAPGARPSGPWATPPPPYHRTHAAVAAVAAPPAGPAHVPSGCGLHLHVCIDPGVGSAPELVSEAWSHVVAHAQDRWGDADDEGGAWEERSSFRSVAFHERCRKSSATFLHLHAPKAHLHLTRADLADLAALPAVITVLTPTPTPATAAGGWDAIGSGRAPPAQNCVLLEIGLRIQLQDDPPAPAAGGGGGGGGAPGSLGAYVPAPGGGAAGNALAMSAASGPAVAAASGAAGGGGPAAAAAAAQSPGLGLVLGGSRVAMYELVVDELTVFRASNLGTQTGCHVTSVHADGVTLLGHLEQQHQQLYEQLQQAAATAGAAAAAAQSSPGGAAVGARGLEPTQRPPPAGLAAAAAAVHHHGGAAQRARSGGASVPYAICLVHCPAAGAGTDSKQPSYIEYVSVEGRRPPTLQVAAGWPAASANWGLTGRVSGSGAINTDTSANIALQPSPLPQQQQQQGDDTATAMHSVLLQGITVTTDHGYVTMDWAAQLGQLLQALAMAAPPPMPSRHGDHGRGAKGHLSVNVVDLALRHEPMDYPIAAAATPRFSSTAAGGSAAAASSGGGGSGRVSPVALALIIEAIHVGLPLGGGGGDNTEHAPDTPPVHTVVLHSLTLHLAAADQRGPGWTAADPRAIREPLLQACGYHRVLQEASIKVVAKQRQFPRRSRVVPVPPSNVNVAAAAAAATALAEPLPPVAVAAVADQQQFRTTLDIEVTNQHLLGVLTVESATLLAHFAMQAGTLMTARQAAAAAAAALPRRGDAGGRPGDLYWDAASSEAGSSAVAGGGGGGSGTCGFSEAGGDVAGSLLTMLLLEEVEENAFRCAPAAPAAATAGGDHAGMPLGGGDLGGVHGMGGGWYMPCVAGPGGAAAATGAAVDAGLSPGGLILIDDFFPVNHQGEYDEDLALVQHPPKGDGGGGGAVAAPWRREGPKMELEGTWYGPDEGPDKRRPTGSIGPANAAGALPPTLGSATQPNGCGCSLRGGADGGDGGVGGRFGFGFEPADVPPAEPNHHHTVDSGSGLFMEGGFGPGSRELVTGSYLHAGGGGGCMDAGSEEPDIDDLLMLTDPRDGGIDLRVGGSAAGAVATQRAAPLPPPPSSVMSVGSSAAARSSCAPTWRLQENYVRVPRKSDEDGAGGGTAIAGGSATGASGSVGGPDLLRFASTASTTAGCGGGGGGCATLGSVACGGAAEQLPPVSRITFKDLSGIWVMHTTRSAAATAAAAPAGGGGSSSSGLQEGRVELVIEGLGFMLESYGPGGHLARHMKLTVHDMEIRDCALEVKQQQRAAAAAVAAAAGSGAAAAGVVGCSGAGGATGGAGSWVRVLGYRAVRGRPRDSRAPLVALALTAVRPNPAACDPRDEEFRLALALLPLRLKLTQDIMSYLTWFGTSVSTALKPAAAVLANMQAALSELDGCEPLPPPYFQRVQIRGFSVMLDYRPRRVDIAALAEGRLLELLNLVPLGGVDLRCKPLTLAGLQGWDGLGAAVLREWLNDIACTQAHKFIKGLAPVNAVVKVGSAVAALVSAPARHLARHDGAAAAAAAGRQLAAHLRRTSAAFARRLICEAMVAGRRAASGAGKALARVGSQTLMAGEYGTSNGDSSYSQSYSHDQGKEDEVREYSYGCEADGHGDGGGGRGGGDEGSSDDDGGNPGVGLVVRPPQKGEAGNEEKEEKEDSEVGDECGALNGPTLPYGGVRVGGGGGGGRGEGGERDEGGGGKESLRRSRSASAAVRKGLSRAALTLGSQQVAAAAGLQRGVSSVARALSAAAAAAPAAAALQGQLKGTLRSMRRALRAQLSQGGLGGGGAAAAAAPPAAAVGYSMQPHPKED